MSLLAAFAAKAWPYALVVAIVLAGWIYVAHLRESLADTTAKLHAAQVELEAATIRAEVVQRQHETAIEALAVEREAADKRSEALREAREAVTAAPEAADGPVAPVLQGALDALRKRRNP